ncbi:hypothetical protein MJT46_012139 [Ovis ammon polii x Ovis aries]|nr:hypothetical protein MJT46_012139 [Ovis ammon polii x Ovis aries]
MVPLGSYKRALCRPDPVETALPARHLCSACIGSSLACRGHVGHLVIGSCALFPSESERNAIDVFLISLKQSLSLDFSPSLKRTSEFMQRMTGFDRTVRASIWALQLGFIVLSKKRTLSSRPLDAERLSPSSDPELMHVLCRPLASQQTCCFPITGAVHAGSKHVPLLLKIQEDDDDDAYLGALGIVAEKHVFTRPVWEARTDWVRIGCFFISDSCACSEVVSYRHAERPPGALQPGMLTHHVASLRPPQPQSLVVLRTQ